MGDKDTVEMSEHFRLGVSGDFAMCGYWRCEAEAAHRRSVDLARLERREADITVAPNNPSIGGEACR